MANVEKISIALPADMATLVRNAVETGDYASSSEVIREALREWKARRAARSGAISEIRRLWDEGIKSGPRSWWRIGISSPKTIPWPADRLLDLLKEKYKLLADNPHMGQARPDIAKELRYHPVGN